MRTALGPVELVSIGGTLLTTSYGWGGIVSTEQCCGVYVACNA